MEGIEWSRPMAPLLPGLHSPSVSKLPSADSKQFSTPMGHSFNPLENRFTAKYLNIYAYPFYGIKFCSSIFIAFGKKSLWKSWEEIKYGRGFVGTKLHFHTRFPP